MSYFRLTGDCFGLHLHSPALTYGASEALAMTSSCFSQNILCDFKFAQVPVDMSHAGPDQQSPCRQTNKVARLHDQMIQQLKIVLVADQHRAHDRFIEYHRQGYL